MLRQKNQQPNLKLELRLLFFLEKKMGSWCHGVPGEQRSFEREKNSNRNLRWLGKEKWDVTNYRERRVFLWDCCWGYTQKHTLLWNQIRPTGLSELKGREIISLLSQHTLSLPGRCVFIRVSVRDVRLSELLTRCSKRYCLDCDGGACLFSFGAHMQTVGESSEIKENNHKQSVYLIKTKRPAEEYFKLLFFSCVHHMSALPQQFETPLAHDTLLQLEKSQITEKYHKINPTHPSLTSDCVVKKHLLCLSEITQDSSPASSIANESTSI